jgi:hypothetical protein
MHFQEADQTIVANTEFLIVKPCRSEVSQPFARAYHLHLHTHTHTHTPWPESASELYRPSYRRLSAKLVPTFADIRCHLASVTNPYGRILGSSPSSELEKSLWGPYIDFADGKCLDSSELRCDTIQKTILLHFRLFSSIWPEQFNKSVNRWLSCRSYLNWLLPWGDCCSERTLTLKCSRNKKLARNSCHFVHSVPPVCLSVQLLAPSGKWLRFAATSVGSQI